MKYIALLAACCLASCATNSEGWDSSDPNDGPTTPGNTLNIRNYATTSSGSQSKELTKPKKPKRFSGSLSFGIGAGF